MKKANLLGLAMCLGGFLLGALSPVGKAVADTGAEGATRIERGSYGDVRKVSVSSVAGTALWDASVKRPDSLCKNYSGSTLFIGTVTTTQDNTVHSNILNGFPVAASDTFKLDGSFTGVLYGTADVEVASIDVRCLDGLVR